MKKEITIGQLVSASVAILISLITGWITMNNKVTALETKMNIKDTEEYNYRLSLEKKLEKMDLKLDDLKQSNNDIKVELQNKENRR